MPASLVRLRIPLLVVALGLLVAGCGINNIPTLEEQAKAKWPAGWKSPKPYIRIVPAPK